jgi:hypothetical protein
VNLENIIETIVRRVIREEIATVAKPTPTMMSVADYATAKAVCESTVRKAIRDGRLEHEKVGAALRIPADAEIRRRGGSGDVAEDRAAKILRGIGGGR